MVAHFCTSYPCPLCYPQMDRWPWMTPQLPAYTAGNTPRDLSGFTDDEIAREYHNRALRKLGDPRVSVGFAGLPEHHQPKSRCP